MRGVNSTGRRDERGGNSTGRCDEGGRGVAVQRVVAMKGGRK